MNRKGLGVYLYLTILTMTLRSELCSEMCLYFIQVLSSFGMDPVWQIILTQDTNLVICEREEMKEITQIAFNSNNGPSGPSDTNLITSIFPHKKSQVKKDIIYWKKAETWLLLKSGTRNCFRQWNKSGWSSRTVSCHNCWQKRAI